MLDVQKALTRNSGGDAEASALTAALESAGTVIWRERSFHLRSLDHTQRPVGSQFQTPLGPWTQLAPHADGPPQLDSTRLAPHAGAIPPRTAVRGQTVRSQDTTTAHKRALRDTPACCAPAWRWLRRDRQTEEGIELLEEETE